MRFRADGVVDKGAVLLAGKIAKNEGFGYHMDYETDGRDSTNVLYDDDYMYMYVSEHMWLRRKSRKISHPLREPL